MTSDGDYFIGVHPRELDRLREQHDAWAPETRALWTQAGFGSGQRIVDLGSGPGFTTLELAHIVGPSGEVTALDKASPYLQFLKREAKERGLANVSTLEADLTAVDAAGASFDGAFSRFFLAFLIADLDRALAAIYRSLKPGGVLAAMEYLTLGSAAASPPLRGFDAHTQGWVRYYEKNGGDTTVGTYLPQRLARAGFEIVSTACVGGVARPSHRWWSWWGRLMADFGEKLVTDGLMSAAELSGLEEDWARASRDPHSFIYTPVLLQITARKP